MVLAGPRNYTQDLRMLVHPEDVNIARAGIIAVKQAKNVTTPNVAASALPSFAALRRRITPSEVHSEIRVARRKRISFDTGPLWRTGLLELRRNSMQQGFGQTAAPARGAGELAVSPPLKGACRIRAASLPGRCCGFTPRVAQHSLLRMSQAFALATRLAWVFQSCRRGASIASTANPEGAAGLGSHPSRVLESIKDVADSSTWRSALGCLPPRRR